MTAPYVPTVWHNDTVPDIDEAHLNHLELGAKSATDGVIALEASAASLGTRVTTLETSGPVAYRRFTKDALSRGAVIGGTDNTTILQTILDEIRDARYGELYLPGKPGDTYYTKGLWVPSGCRVVSDPGVKLNITAPSGVFHSNNIYDSGDLRMTSYDGDLVRSDGLFCGTQNRLDSTGKGGAGAVTGGPYSWNEQAHDIRIENVTIVGGTVVFWAVQGIDLINVKREGGLFGIAFAGLKNGWQGTLDYCGDIRYFNGYVKNVGRNGIELSTVRDALVRGVLIDGVTGNLGAGEQAPGCGIENELENTGSYGWNIQLIENTIRNCAGAGIGFIRNSNPNANFCVARGNRLHSVSTQPLGGTPYPYVGTTGGIWFNGTGFSGEEVIVIEGNHILGVANGGGIAAGTFGGQVLGVGNVVKTGNTGATGTFLQANLLYGNIGL